MAQFDFYGVREDWSSLLKQVAQRQHRIAINRNYRRRHAPSFHPESSFVNKALSAKRSLFIRGTFTGSGQLAFDRIPGKGFVIVDSERPPILRIRLPIPERKKNALRLYHGTLMYHRILWNSDLTRSWWAPTELKAAYRDLIKAFKPCLRKRRVGGSLWIGHHAWDALVKGEALLLFKGYWWSCRKGVARKVARDRHAFSG
jgi:hypothetical protein